MSQSLLPHEVSQRINDSVRWGRVLQQRPALGAAMLGSLKRSPAMGLLLLTVMGLLPRPSPAKTNSKHNTNMAVVLKSFIKS